MSPHRVLLLAMIAAGLGAPLTAVGQNRLPEYPGYERHEEMAPAMREAVVSADIRPDWSEDGDSFTYVFGDTRFRFDVGRLEASEVEHVEPFRAPARRTGAGRVVLARGRGGEVSENSPDGEWTAFTRDGNLYYRPTEGADDPVAITTDGGEDSRIRNGQASYVYIEELAMGPATWWSPDSQKIAFLSFDESEVDDYYLALDQTEMLSSLHVQAYPSPGAPNPIPELRVYDLASGETTVMDVRGGQSFADYVMGHYIWAVEWTEDSSEVLLRRSARLQKSIDLAACEPETGACRTIVNESRPDSWASVSSPQFLEDGERFIWRSDRNGYSNYYLYNLSGELLATLTDNAFDAVRIVEVDEKRGELWYLARSGDNYMKYQLHRVGLDGTGEVRLTDPAWHHTIYMQPGAGHFIDIFEAHNAAPYAWLRDRDGEGLAEIAVSDTSEFEALGLRTVERFEYVAADGETSLFGLLHFPSDFDPAKSYPMLVSIYGGPSSNGAREDFTVPSNLTEYGFILMQVDLRTAAGRGKAALDAIYENFGVIEIDDLAAAVRAVARRSYVDGERVGIYGTSYGGYASAMAILRYPEVFAAAVANSPVTDYRLYDSTYTERYLGLPRDNPEVYDAASTLTFADNLSGDLMIYFGTSDDNVHPKNALTLIEALQRAGKHFEVQVGPDRGHTAVDQDRMMEFFIESLVLDR